MVSIVKRMRKLKALVNIRVGPGAAILPKDVQALSLRFSFSGEHGHMGAKKFWKEQLPRLKYRNPTIPMNVSKTADPETSPLLTILFKGRTIAEPAPSQYNGFDVVQHKVEPARPTVQLELREKSNHDIWGAVQRATDAADCEATEQERVEQQKAVEHKAKMKLRWEQLEREKIQRREEAAAELAAIEELKRRASSAV